MVEFTYFVPSGTHEIGTMIVAVLGLPVELPTGLEIVGCGYRITNAMFLNETEGLYLSLSVVSNGPATTKDREDVRQYIVSKITEASGRIELAQKK